jgi:two-component system cell cycle sensor histidine kinase/response regulator CckA
MLALQCFGLFRGVVAAALVAGYTVILWNHPYAIIIMTAEVAVVGWLIERRKMELVLADTLYWLLVGMPLIYLFYHGVMGVSSNSTAIAMIKQAVNGIANALIARLIFTAVTLRLRSSLTSFSEILYSLLAFFVLCPALITLAISSREDFREIDVNIRSSLLHEREHSVRMLETWLRNRRTVISNLATMAAAKSPPQMQPFLHMARTSDVNFIRVGLLDEKAIITAYSPLVDELGQHNVGKSFADRPFNVQLKESLKPMISEVVMGRIGTPQPMVTMLAPVIRDGAYGGYITGILRLEQIRAELDHRVELNATLYTLLDRNGRVIMSNRSDQTVMDDFVRAAGTTTMLGAGISQRLSSELPNTADSERWMNSVYVTQATVGDLAEWELILEQPVAPFQSALYARYTAKLTLLFLLLLAALGLAKFLSRRMMATLETIRVLSDQLPAKLAQKDGTIAWPQTSMTETSHLIENFKRMADSLTEQFDAVRQINESLEQRVNERTAQLSESEARFKALHNASFGGIVIHDQGVIIDCNKGLSKLTGYTIDELVGMDGMKLIAPEWRESVRLDMKRGEYLVCEVEGLLKDGTRYQLGIHGKDIPYQGRTVRVTELRDISVRKQIEAFQQEALTRLQKITSRVPGVVYQLRLRPDGGLCFPFASEGVRELYRLGPEDLRDDADKIMACVHPDDFKHLKASTLRSAQDLTPWQLDYRVRFDDGTLRWLSGRAMPEREDDGGVLWHGFITDITERKLLEDQVRQLAFYDPLTELPNRRLLNDRLGQALAASARSGCRVVLMFLDLDNFKTLNDTQGHDVGDLLLIEAARRLRNSVREMDTVARFGGDEFVVMIGELSENEADASAQATTVAEKIRARLSEPYRLTIKREGNPETTIEHQCTVSIGVALSASHDATPGDLIKRADSAMYQAKAAGRNSIRFDG